MLKMDYKRHIECTFSLFYIPPQSSTNTKLSSCFEYRGLMIVSKYFVGGGLWRLLNINFKYNYLQKHKLFTDEFHYLK
jgi:hypothetical protein